MAAKYTIDGGGLGKQRLDVLARVCEPGTAQLFDRVGVDEGVRCVDVGCGGGHVSRELARRAGPTGSVVGIDLDASVLELAEADVAAAGITNVEFRCGDAAHLDPEGYDVAYARCLLSHISDPADVVSAMTAALKPGGTLITEDIDLAGQFCSPPSLAHDRYVELYRETVRRRGGNADLGPTLPSLLLGAGLLDVGTAVSHPCSMQGDPKLIPSLTLERIATAVVEEGVASADEVAEVVAELSELSADATTVMGMPRLIQSWGTKPLTTS